MTTEEVHFTARALKALVQIAKAHNKPTQQTAMKRAKSTPKTMFACVHGEGVSPRTSQSPGVQCDSPHYSVKVHEIEKTESANKTRIDSPPSKVDASAPAKDSGTSCLLTSPRAASATVSCTDRPPRKEPAVNNNVPKRPVGIQHPAATDETPAPMPAHAPGSLRPPAPPPALRLRPLTAPAPAPRSPQLLIRPRPPSVPPPPPAPAAPPPARPARPRPRPSAPPPPPTTPGLTTPPASLSRCRRAALRTRTLAGRWRRLDARSCHQWWSIASAYCRKQLMQPTA